MTKHLVIGGHAPLKSGVDNISLFDEKGNELKLKKDGQLQDIESQFKHMGKGQLKDGIISL